MLAGPAPRFDDLDHSSGVYVLHLLHSTVWPSHFDEVDARGWAETKVQAQAKLAGLDVEGPGGFTAAHEDILD